MLFIYGLPALAVLVGSGLAGTLYTIWKVIEYACTYRVTKKMGVFKYLKRHFYYRQSWKKPSGSTQASLYIEEQTIDINFHASGLFGAGTNYNSDNNAMDIFLNNGLIQPGCYDDTDDISQCMQSK